MNRIYIDRALDLGGILKRKSCFLFGPRQSGKTLLIRHSLGTERYYNLLETQTFLKLNRSPERLGEERIDRGRIVVIDEIQKLPALLDEVHRLIEERGIRFLLTGSSARKLRRGGVNLLGGRAWMRHMHPFSISELKDRFDLGRALNYGLLPSIYLSRSPEEDLRAYVGAYLKEEIAAEGLTRNVPAFSRFLEVAALFNGQMINYTKIANDAQVARSTVQEYFEILKDTLLAYEVPAWKTSRKRKPVSTSKMYFFDTGLVRFIQNRGSIRAGSPEFGELFESYIFHELKTYADYRGGGDVAYWRSKSGYEVDFIIGGAHAVEVKASRTVSSSDLRSLKALREEKRLKSYSVVCFEDTRRVADGIEIVPWKEFLLNLWRE